MDLSPFRPGYDAAGKRARSLELYGLGTSFRRSDGFGAGLGEIAHCAARFTGATGASVDVWPEDHAVNLAVADLAAPDVTTPSDPVAGDLERVWALTPAAVEPFAVGPDPAATPPRPTCWAVPLVGQEQVAIGLLTAWHHGPWAPGPDQRLLLRHLAGAAVGVLDRQRQVRQRRTRPGQPSLRAVDAPDRRRDER